jgi:E-phenylitaconyl-CoA hydratase
MTDLNELASLEFEVSDHVATVTLNRPDRMNSFNERMADELAAVWSRVRDDVEIHVGVLQANGDRAFCTGIDVSEGVWWYDKPIFNQEDPGEHLGPKAHKVRKPVIAALPGGRRSDVLRQRVRFAICSESTLFFDPHANAGAVSALEPMGMLAQGVPHGAVMRWALLGSEERLTAQTALRIGW